MTIKQLQYFATIAKHLNFTEAAKELFIAQSALSTSMKKLEDELQLKLFISSGRNIILSDSGKLLEQYVKDFLNQYADFQEKAFAISAKEFGILRVGVPHLLDKLLLSSFFIDFCTTHPNTQIAIINDGARNIQRRVLDNDLNFGISMQPVMNGLESIDGPHSDLVAIIHKDNPLAATDVIELKMLANQNLITLGSEHEIFYEIKRMSAESGVNIEPRISASNVDFIFDLIKENLGITIQARYIAEALSDDRLVIRELENGKHRWNLSLVYPKRELSKSEQNFIQFFSSKFSANIETE